MKDVRQLKLDEQLAYFRGKQKDLQEQALKRDNVIQEHAQKEIDQVNNQASVLHAELKAAFGVDDGKPLNTLDIVELVYRVLNKVIQDGEGKAEIWTPR